MILELAPTAAADEDESHMRLLDIVAATPPRQNPAFVARYRYGFTALHVYMYLPEFLQVIHFGFEATIW